MKKIVLILCIVLGEVNIAYSQRLSNSTIRNFARYLESDNRVYDLCLSADFWDGEAIENRRVIIKNLGVNSSYAALLIRSLCDKVDLEALKEDLRVYMTAAEIKEIESIWLSEMKRREAARLEAERKEKEKRDKHIRDFLAMRDSTIFIMSSADASYNLNKSRLSDCIRKMTERSNLNKIDLLIVDKCKIASDGKATHQFEISGLGSDNHVFISSLCSELESITLSPMSKKEPYTGNSYPVNSHATFSLKYSIIIDEPLCVYKKNGNVILNRGNVAIANANTDYLSKELKKNGRYDIRLTRTDVNGKMVSRKVSINEFRKPIDNLFIEYNYSKSAPCGVTIGLNKIAYSKCWGVYARFKSSWNDRRKLDEANFEYTTERPVKNGYAREGYTAGATFAVFKNIYVYAGLGYGSCAVRYTNEGVAYDNTFGEKAYYQASQIRGLEAECGCIWRFWKWMGVSVGYSTIVPFEKRDLNKFFGDVNYGISLFL